MKASVSRHAHFNAAHRLHVRDWSDKKNEAEDILCDPNIEIVTITVTESGYYISEDNELNLNLRMIIL